MNKLICKVENKTGNQINRGIYMRSGKCYINKLANKFKISQLKNKTEN